MALARVSAFAIDGVESRRVTVEADVRRGLPAFTVVGLADKAVRESRDRVRAAIANSGFTFPDRRVTVNLAPAHLRKAGPGFDLALAAAILVATGQLAPEVVEDVALAGELSLDGEVRPVHGVLAVAEGARRHGIARVVVPLERAAEAAVVDDVEAIGVRSLREAVDVLAGRAEAPPVPEVSVRAPEAAMLDLVDVRGHNALIPALEVVAAGGHNLYLHGPPGTGKTMLARRMPGLLPPMSRVEAMEVTRIHSVAGRHDGRGLVQERPFRSPHHTISASGLVGGGPTPLPGEITLAHNGVLFLDEWSEFNRGALEALRQPLEDGRVVIVRGQRVLVFPTRCMLVAAANPCPCGMGGNACRCSAADVERHARRLSGPLLDRMDVTLFVPRPSARDMRTQEAIPSAVVRERVMEARAVQERRLAGTGASCNGQMTARMVHDLLDATPEALTMLDDLHERHTMSARGRHRVLRLARTVADLAGSPRVLPAHVHAAQGMRSARTAEPVAA